MTVTAEHIKVSPAFFPSIVSMLILFVANYFQGRNGDEAFTPIEFSLRSLGEPQNVPFDPVNYILPLLHHRGELLDYVDKVGSLVAVQDVTSGPDDGPLSRMRTCSRARSTSLGSAIRTFRCAYFPSISLYRSCLIRSRFRFSVFARSATAAIPWTQTQRKPCPQRVSTLASLAVPKVQV